MSRKLMVLSVLAVLALTFAVTAQAQTLGFLIIDFITSSAAFSLERKHPANKGDGWLLFQETVSPFQHRRPDPIVGVQGQYVRTQGSFDPGVSGTR